MWKAIEGYAGLYEVSNSGQVKALARLETVSSGWSRLKNEKILRQTLDHNGYAYVDLCHKYAKKRFYIQQLVLSTFGEPRKDNLFACHEDGDRTNNNISNLRWDTQKGNLADTLKHGTRIQGEKHKFSKLTPNDVLQIRELARLGKGAAEISRNFPCSRENIRDIINGKKWKHI